MKAKRRIYSICSLKPLIQGERNWILLQDLQMTNIYFNVTKHKLPLKIFNKQPVKENFFIFEPSKISQSTYDQIYLAGFSFKLDVVDSLNTLSIFYNLQYIQVGHFGGLAIQLSRLGDFSTENWEVIEHGDILLFYSCSTSFNFKTLGLDKDILSLNTFLISFYKGVKKFLSQDRFADARKKEEEYRIENPLEEITKDLIRLLTEAGLYSFR